MVNHRSKMSKAQRSSNPIIVYDILEDTMETFSSLRVLD